MTNFNLGICRYFFGDIFNLDVVATSIGGSNGLRVVLDELASTIKTGEVHTGTQIIGYTNVDTGLFMSIIMNNPLAPSCISMFAESNHRLWGGSSLVCVPLVFCIDAYQPSGNYVVYRHTYKEPSFTGDEIAKIMKDGTETEKIKAFAFTKSRDGYKTIHGMSYVGITKNRWQERYKQHVEDAIEKISERKFHEAIRGMQGENVIHVHDVVACGIPYDDARMIEKKLITESTLWPKGLNMRL